MASHTSRVKQLSIACSLALVVVLVLFNAILARANLRIDLTEEGLYTLSEGSERILGGLEDPARIRVFWHNVPVRFDNSKRYIAALLEEMESASDGKVQPQWVDMTEDAGLDQASELALEEHTFSAQHGAEIRHARGYMTLVIELGDEEPVKINELANITDKLEYRIVSSIFKAQRAAPPIIGFVGPEPGMAMGMRGRQPSRFELLQREMRFAFGSAFRDYVKLDTEVPPDVDVLIVADPRDFTEEQVYHFEQFLLRGGRGLLLVDPIDLGAVFGRGVRVVRPNTSGLEDWLAYLGVTIEKGCVVDFHDKASCLYPLEHRDAMGRPVGVEWVRYAHWPKVLPENMDESNPVMRYLPPMPMYWPGPLSVDTEKQAQAGRQVEILATTSEQGFRRQDVTNIRQPGLSQEGKLLETVPLIALIDGPATSFWKGKPVPGTEPPPGEDGVEDGGEDAPEGDGAGAPDGAGSPDGDAGPPDGDAPAPEQPKPDEPAPEEPKPDEPGKDAPGKEQPGEDGAEDGGEDAPEGDGADAPDGAGSPDGGAGTPDGDAAAPEEPKPDEPKPDAPAPEEPKPDEPGKDAPGKEQPGKGAPGKDAPGDGADGDGEADAEEPDVADGAEEDEAVAGPQRRDEGRIRLVVLGDADLVSNTFSPQNWLARANGATGFTFVQNMTEWLSGSEELMALRARATNPRNLEQIEEGERDVIKWVNLLLVPLLMVLAGMTVFFVRRS